MAIKFYLIKLALALIAEWVDSHVLENRRLVDELAKTSDFTPAFLNRIISVFDAYGKSRYKAGGDASDSFH